MSLSRYICAVWKLALYVVLFSPGVMAADIDLSGVPSAERQMIENACSSSKYLGPANFYDCLSRQVKDLSQHAGKPSLANASTQEEQMIEGACSSSKYLGPASYYDCLNRQVKDLSHHAGKPSIAGASPQERQMIENACSSSKYLGPASYYDCLERQVRALNVRYEQPNIANPAPNKPRGNEIEGLSDRLDPSWGLLKMRLKNRQP